jgi:hypothetical protein
MIDRILYSLRAVRRGGSEGKGALDGSTGQAVRGGSEGTAALDGSTGQAVRGGSEGTAALDGSTGQAVRGVSEGTAALDKLILILELCQSNNMDLEDVADILRPDEVRGIVYHMRQIAELDSLANLFEASCSI